MLSFEQCEDGKCEILGLERVRYWGVSHTSVALIRLINLSLCFSFPIYKVE